MKTSVIRYRVADFLKQHPPFNEVSDEDFSLDALYDLFAVEPHDRHTAGGDAFITAHMFIRLLRLAEKRGRSKLGALTSQYLAA